MEMGVDEGVHWGKDREEVGIGVGDFVWFDPRVEMT